MKNPALKFLTPAMAVACLGLLPGTTQAQTPVFDYTFPASWAGSGTTVIDQSSADNTGLVYNRTKAPAGTLVLSSSVPPGAAPGTESINTSYGAIVTGASGSLDNAVVAAAGGFIYNVEFDWNGGGYTGYGTQKIIDYAGTESLQLTGYTQGAENTSATLGMSFGGDTGTAPDVDVLSTTISANTWYDVQLVFNTEGSSYTPGGDLSGIASLYVNGVLVDSAAATKGIYGDSLGRPIGVGQLGADFGYLVGFSGDIYSASVELVPEPSSLALSALGGLGVLGMMRKARRRNA